MNRPPRILVIHNEYGAVSGEEIALGHVVDTLKERGHELRRYSRSSAEIDHMLLGKPRALLTGIFNPHSRHAIHRVLEEFSPDLVLVKNLYPLISPAILPVIHNANIPIVMSVANYRLICPNGLHMSSDGKVCERCTGGREYHCALHNCERNLPKSIGYALRNFVARKAGWYKDNISAFICASHFLKAKLAAAGFSPRRLHVIPNLVPDPVPNQELPLASEGQYVAYLGRISEEKGVPTILRAAALCPDIEFRLAGKLRPGYELPTPVSTNVKLLGHLEKKNQASFFSNARMLISASECYETFGMSVAEASLHQRPVIASRIGVFPEFVEENITGLLFDPGNAQELAAKIRALWQSPDLCQQMGHAGRQRALREYSRQTYYDRISSVFNSLLPVRAASPRAA